MYCGAQIEMFKLYWHYAECQKLSQKFTDCKSFMNNIDLE